MENSKSTQRIIDFVFVAAVIAMFVAIETVRTGNLFRALGASIAGIAVSLFFFALASFITGSRVIQRVVLVLAAFAFLFFGYMGR